MYWDAIHGPTLTMLDSSGKFDRDLLAGSVASVAPERFQGLGILERMGLHMLPWGANSGGSSAGTLGASAAKEPAPPLAAVLGRRGVPGPEEGAGGQEVDCAPHCAVWPPHAAIRSDATMPASAAAAPPMTPGSDNCPGARLGHAKDPAAVAPIARAGTEAEGAAEGADAAQGLAPCCASEMPRPSALETLAAAALPSIGVAGEAVLPNVGVALGALSPEKPTPRVMPSAAKRSRST